MSCNGCRVLRKGCSENCTLRPCLAGIEGSEAQGHATLFLAKFFGRAGLMNFIQQVSDSQRPALFQSLLYEACGRTINPVYGSAGLLWSGQWHACESAVDTVLKGGSLTEFQQPPCTNTSTTPNGNNASATYPQAGSPLGPSYASFSFPGMEAAPMAYWPLTMTPMNNAASAAAAYQASMYQMPGGYTGGGAGNGGAAGGASSMPAQHLHMHPHPQSPHTHAHVGVPLCSPDPHSASQSIQQWQTSTATATGNGGGGSGCKSQQSPARSHGGCRSPVNHSNASGSVTGGSSGGERSSGTPRGPGTLSPPVVAPVARRATPHGCPAAFVPALAPNSSLTLSTAGMEICMTSSESVDSAGDGSDYGMHLAAWAHRSAPEPASHSLLPLLS
eukprot:jgi/Mesen1/6172/ME000317S05298